MWDKSQTVIARQQLQPESCWSQRHSSKQIILWTRLREGRWAVWDRYNPPSKRSAVCCHREGWSVRSPQCQVCRAPLIVCLGLFSFDRWAHRQLWHLPKWWQGFQSSALCLFLWLTIFLSYWKNFKSQVFKSKKLVWFIHIFATCRRLPALSSSLDKVCSFSCGE